MRAQPAQSPANICTSRPLFPQAVSLHCELSGQTPQSWSRLAPVIKSGHFGILNVPSSSPFSSLMLKYPGSTENMQLLRKAASTSRIPKPLAHLVGSLRRSHNAEEIPKLLRLAARRTASGVGLPSLCRSNLHAPWTVPSGTSCPNTSWSPGK